MKSYVRAFIAVDMAPSIRREAHKALRPIQQAFPSVKWVDDENFHVTLKFLGSNVPTNELHRVIQAIERACKGVEQFDLVFEGLGAFPDTTNPRTIWVGVSDGVEELQGLAKRIDDELEKFGFPSEGRKLSPHLTVGRARQRDRENKRLSYSLPQARNSQKTNEQDREEVLSQQKQNSESDSFDSLTGMINERSQVFFGASPVDTVILYSSELERGGPKYERLAEIELSPLGFELATKHSAFDAKEYDNLEFKLDSSVMKEHFSTQTLDSKFNVDTLDAEVEQELSAICGSQFAKKNKKFSVAPRGGKPNVTAQKQRLSNIVVDEDIPSDLDVALNEFATLVDARSLRNKNCKHKK